MSDPAQPDAPCFFISYSHQDPVWRDAVVEALEAAGISSVWDDSIQSGQRISQQVQQAIDAATKVMVLWTQNSVASSWVHAEASEAVRQGKYFGLLLGVRLDQIPIEMRVLKTESVETKGLPRAVKVAAADVERTTPAPDATHNPLWFLSRADRMALWSRHRLDVRWMLLVQPELFLWLSILVLAVASAALSAEAFTWIFGSEGDNYQTWERLSPPWIFLGTWAGGLLVRLWVHQFFWRHYRFGFVAWHTFLEDAKQATGGDSYQFDWVEAKLERAKRHLGRVRFRRLPPAQAPDGKNVIRHYSTMHDLHRAFRFQWRVQLGVVLVLAAVSLGLGLVADSAYLAVITVLSIATHFATLYVAGFLRRIKVFASSPGAADDLHDLPEYLWQLRG